MHTDLVSTLDVFQKNYNDEIRMDYEKDNSQNVYADINYDLNGDNLIDTSITFSGLVLASLPGPSSEEIAGNGYILFS